MLRVIDTYWMQHIDTMSELRQGVMLQAYGQQNPLVIYQKEGYRLFEELVNNISRDITKYVLKANIQVNVGFLKNLWKVIEKNIDKIG